MQCRAAKSSKLYAGMCTCVNPCVQLHVCTICLSTCYNYPCLRVVSVDVVCIPACIIELFCCTLLHDIVSLASLIYNTRKTAIQLYSCLLGYLFAMSLKLLGKYKKVLYRKDMVMYSFQCTLLLITMGGGYSVQFTQRPASFWTKSLMASFPAT